MKSNSLDHAKHNEEVCHYLDIPKDKHDWVVTTAFYSALHYVNHKLFPYNFEVKPKTKQVFETFEDYYHYYRSIYPDVNKHEALKKLVRREIASVADEYDNLLNMSSNARYLDYNLPIQFSKGAKKSLNKIKAHCTK